MANRNEHDTGKNLGQGLANINDNDRRDLSPSGDDAKTKDQTHKLTSGERGHSRHTTEEDRSGQ